MRYLLPLTVLLALATLIAPTALAKTLDQRLEEAGKDLAHLENLLDDDDATNREIKTFMDIVLKSAREMAIPESAPEGMAADDFEKKKRGWSRDLESYRKDVVDALLEALDETNLDRAGENIRTPVNVHAGPLLGEARAFLPETSDRKRLSRRILRKIKRLERARHPVEAEVFGGAFLGLAKLGQTSSLEWLMDNYLHTRKKPEDVARLREAMTAMRAFPSIPGDMRYELADEMLKKYVAVEALAMQSSTDVSAIAAKRFWDQVRTEAIPLMQHVTGYPRTASGIAIATMADFEDWFRDHDHKHKAPWNKPVTSDETPADGI